MDTPNTDVIQGTLDLLILKTLATEPKHGWAIAKRIQQVSDDVLQITQGSLYPALHRLEQKRWLKSAWRQSETGREAKFYAITRAGQRQLAAESVLRIRRSSVPWSSSLRTLSIAIRC